MITVACVFVKGHVKFTVEYVAKLRAMVAKHLAQPHRVVCLTDRPELMPAGVDAIRIAPVPRDVKAWWAKMYLFKPGLIHGDRVLYLDLDTVVVDSLDPIADFASPFALVPDAGTFKAKTHHLVVKRFNSSVMVWNRGVTDALFQQFDMHADASRYWGDQDVIGERMPGADRMPLSWFPRLSALKDTAPLPPAKVVLAKVPKNHIAAELYPWFDEAWRAA